MIITALTVGTAAVAKAEVMGSLEMLGGEKKKILGCMLGITLETYDNSRKKTCYRR